MRVKDRVRPSRTRRTFAAVQATKDGHDVQAVLDASGAINDLGREAALWRTQDAGVTPTSYNAIASELLHDWADEEGDDQVTKTRATEDRPLVPPHRTAPDCIF